MFLTISNNLRNMYLLYITICRYNNYYINIYPILSYFLLLFFRFLTSKVEEIPENQLLLEDCVKNFTLYL